MHHVYPARPVEPGTLRVFNWGAMFTPCNAEPIALGRSLFHWGAMHHALCTMRSVRERR